MYLRGKGGPAQDMARVMLRTKGNKAQPGYTNVETERKRIQKNAEWLPPVTIGVGESEKCLEMPPSL